MAPSVVPPQPTVEDSREDATASLENQDVADDAASGDEAEEQQPKDGNVQTPTGGAPPKKKKKKKRTRKIGHVSFFILGLVVDKDKLTWDRQNRRVGKVIMSTEHGIYNNLIEYRVLR
jgi:hypothetical protein